MKTLHTHNEEMKKKFDEEFELAYFFKEIGKKEVKGFITNSHKQLYIKIAEGELERLRKRVWDNSTRKYDGNDLDSACKFHSIGAIDWVEILRYEDGQNHLIWEEIDRWNNILQELNK